MVRKELLLFLLLVYYDVPHKPKQEVVIPSSWEQVFGVRSHVFDLKG